jgi:hypothetical protein
MYLYLNKTKQIKSTDGDAARTSDHQCMYHRATERFIAMQHRELKTYR